MNNKIQTLAQLATNTTSRLTASYTGWTAFLQTAARLYKYPYSEQLLIYAQRPDATACADFDLWNQRMNRSVRRGSKGIAIVDTSRGAPQIKYVFDIADTVERPNARHPYLWELTEYNQDTVRQALSDHYDISAEMELEWQLESIADTLAEGYWQDNQTDILASLEGSFLEELDEDNIRAAFCHVAAASTLYALLARCGLDADEIVQHEDMMDVSDFNTPAMATALGTAVSMNSERVLRQIEVTIKNFERSRANGRIELQAGGELPAPAVGDGAAAEAGQVRPAAAGISEGTPAGAVQPSDSGRNVEPASDGDRPNSDGSVRVTDAPASEVHGDIRAVESPGTHEVGGFDAQRQAESRGNDLDGAGVQLEDDSGQFSLFGSADFKPPAHTPRPGGEVITLRPQVPQTAIYEALRIGANDPTSRLRIVAEFMKGKSTQENAAFLEKHYGENGAGFYVGERKYALWYNEAGLMISPGESVNERFAASITWEQATECIHELLDIGEYAGQVTLYRAWPFERNRVAQALEYLHRDIDDGYKQQYLPTLTAALDGIHVYPDVVDKTKELLSQPGQLEAVIDEFTVFMKDYAHNRDILRFHFHRTDEILQGLKDLQLEPVKYTAAEGFSPQRRLFISQDEVDHLLREAPDQHDYRIKMYQFFEKHPDRKEREKYLSHLHGEYSGFSGGNDNITYTYKQVEFSHGSITNPYAEVKLKWSRVRKRIEELIAKDAFLSAEDKEIMESRYLEVGTDAPAPAPTIRELFEHYKPKITEMVLQDEAYRNACLNSDKDTALFEGREAVKRAVLGSDDMQLVKLFYDIPSFTRQIMDGVVDETYPVLSALQPAQEQRVSSPYQVVVYHHIENGFDERLEYQTLEEAQRVAEGYVDGTYEDDGFQYDGAGVFDVEKREWLYVAGHLPVLGDNIELPYLPYPLAPLDKARQRIREYYEREYGSLADTDNLREISVAHTTVGDSELPLQVNVDLIQSRLDRYLDGVLLERRQYSSLQELTDAELENLNFADLTYVTDEEIAKVTGLGGTVTEPSPPRDPLAPAYKVGDTVYLEGTAFTITEIGPREVQLQDPTLAYPIFRTENRENFEKLLRRDDKNLPVTDYFSISEISLADNGDDLRDVLTGEGGLLDADGIAEVSRWLEAGYGNAELAHRLEEKYNETVETMTLETGETADYRLYDNSFSIDLLDKYNTVRVYDLRTVAGVLRAMYQQELGGFTHTPAQEPPVVITTVDAVYPAEKNNLPFDIVVEKLHIPGPEKAPNFRITDDDLGVGGTKAHYKMNTDAIKLLRQLQSENRQATPEEQDILSKYVGWGGLSDAFDDTKPAWASEYKELQELLSPEEYASARGSTLNAHYTRPMIIRAIYQALENMGFRGGNILEPSMGVGNFFGCLPESMAKSKLYGVELDSITGQIAQQLYPQADIAVAGFETTDRRNFYDIAVGNVPFGNYQVNDPAYNKLGFSIHNYFIAKALDQVRPGGIVAVLTSRYTLDSKDTKVRKYLAERADLLGAIRLPNGTFMANAGTEAMEDILFLQKRETPAVETPSWVETGETLLGFRINRYFLDNPHMVLGTEKVVSSQYKEQDYSVAPFPDADLSDLLAAAITHIHGEYVEATPPDLDMEDRKPTGDVQPADPNVKNFSYTIRNGDVYYQQNSIMVNQMLGEKSAARVKGLIGLRDCVQKLIGQQLDSFISDESIRETQAELDRLYDAFSKEFGLINDRGNRLAFSQDSSYYLLCALEVLDEENHFLRKADMFTKRTIAPHMEITHVDTASEALAVSIAEKACVDLGFMASLMGGSEHIPKIVDALKGSIFKDPRTGPFDLDGDAADWYKGWQTADEYLSGNVREKLVFAQAAAVTDPNYQINVDALTEAQPKDLDASEIDVRLGATWIDPKYYEQFMLELLETPISARRSIHITHSNVAEIWNISGKSAVPSGDIPAYTTYGTSRASAYRLLEDALNLRNTRIFDTYEDAHGKEKRVLNAKETMLAQEKQAMIKQAFQDWIFRDPDRRQTLVDKYNVEMNSIRPREYNGDNLVLAGMNPAITLEKHQRDAIARAIYGGNTLFAHCVGAGKTFEITATAMESKRLGLCHKSMIVVPNHLTQQWASEFLTLYPNANILVTTKRDFETSRRKKFCARIAAGDYDAVIIGYSQFEKIPISAERQERLLKQEIRAITHGIAEIKEANGERFSVKAMERTKKSLEAKLEKLQANERKDTVITFEELGVDRLFVDESDSFKNLFFATKMQNVAGLSSSESQRATDMFLKTRYLDELTGSKGVVFATGTPISNSIAEMYTVQRYLQYETLKAMGMAHFDSWASRFGETVTSMELAPEGTGYRQRTRFAKFYNLPELMNIFHEAADIKTEDMLNLPVPEAVYHNEVAKPTEFQLAYLKELSERATKIHNREVDSSVDNMLCVTNDGRKLGLDQRLIDPSAEDASESKLNMCVDNIVKIWQDGTENKLTQMVFCDSSTPKKDGFFNVYNDIKAKLIARGIPENEIAFIHDANSDIQKKALFAKVRSGSVRVLLGSTEKMGAGTNAQDRLIALHNLDCPWRPRDLTQREGRIVRRGNMNSTVHIYRYVTENTFDAYLWQTVQKKQEFIGQIMTSKSPMRSCEDVDSTALDFAEVKALCAGDPRIKERMELDVDVAKLKILQASHRSQQYHLEDRLRLSLPKAQADAERRIQCLQEDIATAEAHPQPKEGFVGMKICGRACTERKAAGAALLEISEGFNSFDAEEIGHFRGFTLYIRRKNFLSPKEFLLRGKLTYVIEAGDSCIGNVTKIENALARLPAELEKARAEWENIKQQIVNAQAEIGKPFPQEQELKDKIARMAELDRVLQLEETGGQKGEKPRSGISLVEPQEVVVL